MLRLLVGHVVRRSCVGTWEPDWKSSCALINKGNRKKGSGANPLNAPVFPSPLPCYYGLSFFCWLVGLSYLATCQSFCLVLPMLLVSTPQPLFLCQRSLLLHDVVHVQGHCSSPFRMPSHSFINFVQGDRRRLTPRRAMNTPWIKIAVLLQGLVPGIL